MGFLQEVPLEPGYGRLVLNPAGATLTWYASDGSWRTISIPKTHELRAAMGRSPVRDVPIVVGINDVRISWHTEAAAHMEGPPIKHRGAIEFAEYIKGVPTRWHKLWASFPRW